MLAEPLKLTPPIVRAVCKVVAVAALPVVLWLPAVLTPGRLMLSEPLKLTPPIVRAVASVVAVVALPLSAPVKVVAVTLPELFTTRRLVVPLRNRHSPSPAVPLTT